MEWRHILPKLAEAEYQAMTLDFPHQGKPFPHPDGHIDSMHELAEFVWTFADSQGINQLVVSECSIGGSVILDLAANHSGELTGTVPRERGLSSGRRRRNSSPFPSSNSQ